MKKLFILLFIAALLPLTAKAATEVAMTESVPAGQTIEDNYVKAANSVDISGTVNGDVMVAGSTLDISGKVAGDVIAAAANINITGEVLGNVRVAGSNVTINGHVGKNVNILAGTAEFGQDSQISGTAGVWAGTINFKGAIDGKIDAGARQVEISGTLKKDVILKFEAEKRNNVVNLTVSPTAVITGNLDYYGWNNAQIDSGAKISGQTTRHDPQGPVRQAKKFFDNFAWFMRFASLFGLLVIGLVIISLFKKEAKELPETMTRQPGKSLLCGLIILLLTPLVCFALLFTLIGIPLAVIAGILYAILIYVSQVFIGLFIGRKILEYFAGRKKKENSPKKEVSLFWSMILGVLVFILGRDWLLGFGWPGAWGALGFLGGTINFFLLIWVLGGLYLHKRDKMPNNSKNSPS